MRRGTTPNYTFLFPVPVEEIAEVRVLYAQDEKVLLLKTLGDCTIHDDSISVRLTQEETFLFDKAKALQVQMRALTKDGVALATEIMRYWVKPCLEDEVLTVEEDKAILGKALLGEMILGNGG